MREQKTQGVVSGQTISSVKLQTTACKKVPVLHSFDADQFVVVGGDARTHPPKSDQSCCRSMQMCMLFDFLPETPTSPLTAATLLGGGSVPGVLRQRPLRRVPRRRCRCLGPAAVDDVSPHLTLYLQKQFFVRAARGGFGESGSSDSVQVQATFDSHYLEIGKRQVPIGQLHDGVF